MVQATKDDNLDSIIEKILSQESIKSKFSVYSMFYITHKHYIPTVNILLQMIQMTYLVILIINPYKIYVVNTTLNFQIKLM